MVGWLGGGGRVFFFFCFVVIVKDVKVIIRI